MIVRPPPPPPGACFDHGYSAGIHRGRVEAESALAAVSRAEIDDSFRAGFAEGARLGYVNGYMQGSGDCAAAVVAHENGTPEAAPAPFGNLRNHLDLLSSVAARPALPPPPPPRPLIEAPAAAAAARADAAAAAAISRARASVRSSTLDRPDSPPRGSLYSSRYSPYSRPAPRY